MADDINTPAGPEATGGGKVGLTPAGGVKAEAAEPPRLMKPQEVRSYAVQAY